MSVSWRRFLAGLSMGLGLIGVAGFAVAAEAPVSSSAYGEEADAGPEEVSLAPRT